MSYTKAELKQAIQDYSEKLNALGDTTGAFSIDIASGNHVSLTLTGDATLSISNAPPSGNFGILLMYVSQDATGGHTLTFPAAFVNTAGSNFTISDETASTMTQVFAFTLDGGTTWRAKQGDTWS